MPESDEGLVDDERLSGDGSRWPIGVAFLFAAAWTTPLTVASLPNPSGLLIGAVPAGVLIAHAFSMRRTPRERTPGQIGLALGLLVMPVVPFMLLTVEQADRALVGLLMFGFVLAFGLLAAGLKADGMSRYQADQFVFWGIAAGTSLFGAMALLAL